MSFGWRMDYYRWTRSMKIIAGVASLVDGMTILVTFGTVDPSLRARVSEWAVRRTAAQRRAEQSN